jgi:hypothetical protein
VVIVVIFPFTVGHQSGFVDLRQVQRNERAIHLGLSSGGSAPGTPVRKCAAIGTRIFTCARSPANAKNPRAATAAGQPGEEIEALIFDAFHRNSRLVF